MDLINEIKRKKELEGISNSLVSKALKNYLEKNKISIKNISKKDKKIIIKEVREELRNYVGRFQVKSSLSKKLKLLEENKISDLLKTHSSTKERLPNYDELLNLIKSINPSSILDLACGLNPIAIADKIKNNKIKYYAIDINSDDLKILKVFFKRNEINSKTINLDITSLKNIDKLPSSDLCLLLKILDIIEKGNYKFSEDLLKKLKCTTFIVSFSTKTLSGKQMHFPRRLWFEKILKKLNFDFKIEKTSNEIFYLAEKNHSLI